MPIAYGYIRVSSPGQVVSGLSFEAQQEAITRHFEFTLAHTGYTWGGFYEDPAVSGKLPFSSRKQGGAKLSIVLERNDVVLFAKLDRGFRNLQDLLLTHSVWKGRGIRMMLLDLNMDTFTPVGQLVMTILGAVAEFERSRISERCRDAKAAQRARGQPTNGMAPYGQRIVRKDGRFVFAPDLYERSIGKLIVKWRLAGYSMESIYLHLCRQKVVAQHGNRGKRGKGYSLRTCYRMFKLEVALMQKEMGGNLAPLFVVEDPPVVEEKP